MSTEMRPSDAALENEPVRAKKVYFGGLDELRAIAAFCVVLHHVELYKARDGISSLYQTPAVQLIQTLGKSGVSLFFVLSGFLITFLLLREKQVNGRIRYGAFLMRRSLRIWPLYYLIVIAGFFLIPGIFSIWEPLQGEAHYANLVRVVSTELKGPLGLYLLFFPNVSLAIYPAVVGASQAWSIGTEEQFYLIWPLLLFLFRGRTLVWAILGVLVVKLTLQHLVLPQTLSSESAWVLQFLAFFKIELMALGAIGAFLQFFHRGRIRKLLSSSSLLVGHLLAMGIALSVPFAGGEMILGITFLILIMYQANDTPATLSVPWLGRLGKISYGIYMFHPLVMYFSFAVLHATSLEKGGAVYQIAIYFLVLVGSVGLSAISYRWFESIFLKLKDSRFSPWR